MNKQFFYNQQNNNYSISGSRLAHILALLPPKKDLKILDMGCGKGELAQTLINLGHQVYGADVSNEALEVAKKFLVRHYCFNFEDENWPVDLLKEKFDVVVASEVVEHVFWPVEFLNNLSLLVKDDGRIIVTTPNFLFWKNRLKMFFGFFNYQKNGLLDFGHIRFFSYDFFKKTIQQSQLKIDCERNFYPNFYKRGLSFLGALLPGLFAYQFIVSLTKKN